jgi:hypothetical protein
MSSLASGFYQFMGRGIVLEVLRQYFYYQINTFVLLVTYFAKFTLSECIVSLFNLNHSFYLAKASLIQFLTRLPCGLFVLIVSDKHWFGLSINDGE